MISLRKMFVLLLAILCVCSVSGCGSAEGESEVTAATLVEGQDEVFEQMESIAQENSDADIGKYEVPAEIDFIWEEIEGGVVLTGYTGTITAVEVPAQLGGQDVIEIGTGAFSNVPVVGIKLPDTVIKIGEKAFYYNTTLIELVLGSSTETIGTAACEGCIALTSLILNDGLQSIEYMAFATTYSLQEIELPATLEELGEGAFVFSGLTSIRIPGSVEQIGKQAFSMCSGLEEVVVDPGVSGIGKRAFESCEALKSIEIPASVETFEYGVFMYADNVTVYAPAGSAAENYAKENGIDFKEN